MKRKKIELSTGIIIGAVTLVIGLVVGMNWDGLARQFGPYFGAKVVNELDFGSLNDVYKELASNYDGDLDQEKVIEEAKRGLVKAAGDRYTYFLTRQEAKVFMESLEGNVGAGIGVEIGERDGYMKVLRTLPDNPAREAGVLAGDVIYKVDGKEIWNKTSEEAANAMRGEVGTDLVLTVMRDGKEKEFKLTRETINNVSAYIDYKGKTAILTVTRFDVDMSLARGLASEAKERGVEKIILDLRGNGGGYVSGARDLLGLWLDGEFVVEQKSKDGIYNEKTYTTRGGAILSDMETVVLINGSSASASEIVAGALRDYGKVVLIGEKSYGKGSVQTLRELDGGELLRVTIAKWYLPKGGSIEGEGIEPDVRVERSFDDINHERDPQLDRALEY